MAFRAESEHNNYIEKQLNFSPANENGSAGYSQLESDEIFFLVTKPLKLGVQFFNAQNNEPLQLPRGLMEERYVEWGIIDNKNKDELIKGSTFEPRKSVSLYREGEGARGHWELTSVLDKNERIADRNESTLRNISLELLQQAQKPLYNAGWAILRKHVQCVFEAESAQQREKFLSALNNTGQKIMACMDWPDLSSDGTQRLMDRTIVSLFEEFETQKHTIQNQDKPTESHGFINRMLERNPKKKAPEADVDHTPHPQKRSGNKLINDIIKNADEIHRKAHEASTKPTDERNNEDVAAMLQSDELEQSGFKPR